MCQLLLCQLTMLLDPSHWTSVAERERHLPKGAQLSDRDKQAEDSGQNPKERDPAIRGHVDIADHVGTAMHVTIVDLSQGEGREKGVETQ